MSKIVRPAHAFEGEIVRIKWILKDGGTFEQDVMIPPADTRRAREMEDKYRERIPESEPIRYARVVSTDEGGG